MGILCLKWNHSCCDGTWLRHALDFSCFVHVSRPWLSIWAWGTILHRGEWFVTSLIYLTTAWRICWVSEIRAQMHHIINGEAYQNYHGQWFWGSNFPTHMIFYTKDTNNYHSYANDRDNCLEYISCRQKQYTKTEECCYCHTLKCLAYKGQFCRNPAPPQLCSLSSCLHWFGCTLLVLVDIILPPVVYRHLELPRVLSSANRNTF